MTNVELIKIREEKNLSKKEFAVLLGVTPMLLGRYEKGTCAIPESVAQKLAGTADAATAMEIEVKKNTRKAVRETKKTAEDAAAIMKEAAGEQAVADEIEVKKTVRKAGRKTAEAVKDAVAQAATSDDAVAAQIEVKKSTRKAGRKVIEKAEQAVAEVKEVAKKVAGIPNIIIQSPMGGYITSEDIAKKVPQGTTDVYVRVDENKLYYVLENGETGDVDIWD